MQFTKGKAYLIKWHDHWAYQSTWTSSHDHESELVPMNVTSIGICIGESSSVVRICVTLDQNGAFGGGITIMKNAISEAWELDGAL